MVQLGLRLCTSTAAGMGSTPPVEELKSHRLYDVARKTNKQTKNNNKKEKKKKENEVSL